MLDVTVYGYCHRTMSGVLLRECELWLDNEHRSTLSQQNLSRSSTMVEDTATALAYLESPLQVSTTSINRICVAICTVELL